MTITCVYVCTTSSHLSVNGPLNYVYMRFNCFQMCEGDRCLDISGNGKEGTLRGHLCLSHTITVSILLHSYPIYTYEVFQVSPFPLLAGG